MDIDSFVIDENFVGKRIDVFLAEVTENSRSYIQKNISAELVKLNSKIISNCSTKLKLGDIVAIQEQELKKDIAEPENIPIDIIYQDSDLAVINKPRGMSVHPGAGRSNGTLVNAILYNIKDLSGIGGTLRPGIVHRPDMNTSGLILIAKNDKAHENLSYQFENRLIKKEYYAIVHGKIDHGMKQIIAPIARNPYNKLKMAVKDGGKYAETLFTPLDVFKSFSYVKIFPKTGRTHQIRVHLSYIGYPIMGDFLYGAPKNKYGIEVQMLHAGSIKFIHPTLKEEMKFEVECPKDMKNILEDLRNN